MVSWHGKIFGQCERFWWNLRRFFYEHKTLFDIVFLMIYALEQLTLTLLIYLIPTSASLIAGIFALVVVTTVSFEKICMESRYTESKRQLLMAVGAEKQLVELVKRQSQDYEELLQDLKAK